MIQIIKENYSQLVGSAKETIVQKKLNKHLQDKCEKIYNIANELKQFPQCGLNPDGDIQMLKGEIKQFIA